MPRVVGDSEDDIELTNSVRRTRASISLTNSIPDSPVRRSTRNRQQIMETSPDLDELPVGRTTRSRAATIDKGMLQNPRNLRSRKNSASSDQSESVDIDSETTQRRITRGSASVLSTSGITKTSLRSRRSIRAGSETKSTPPVTRVKRVTRASSVDPVGNSNESSSTFKRHTRSSMVLTQPTVIEEKDVKSQNSTSLDSTPIERDKSESENSTPSSKEKSTKNLLKNTEDEVNDSVNDLEISTLDASKISEESVNNKSNISNEMIKDLEFQSLITDSNKINLKSLENEENKQNREIHINSSVKSITQNVVTKSNYIHSSMNQIEVKLCKYTTLNSSTNNNDDENIIIDVEELSEPSLTNVSVIDSDNCIQPTVKIEQVQLDMKDAYVKLDRTNMIKEISIENKVENQNDIIENKLNIGNINDSNLIMTPKIILNDCIKGYENTHLKLNRNETSFLLENKQENIDSPNVKSYNENRLIVNNMNNINDNNNKKDTQISMNINKNDEKEILVHEKENSFSIDEKYNQQKNSQVNFNQSNECELNNPITKNTKNNEVNMSNYINEQYNKVEDCINIDISNDPLDHSISVIKDSISVIECDGKSKESEALNKNNNNITPSVIKNSIIDNCNENLSSRNQQEVQIISTTELSDTYCLQDEQKEKSLLQQDKQYKDSNSISKITVQKCSLQLENINNINQAISSFDDKTSTLKDIGNISCCEDKIKSTISKNYNKEINNEIPLEECNKNMEINQKSPEPVNKNVDNEVMSNSVEIELHDSEDSDEIEIINIIDEIDPNSNQNEIKISKVDKNSVPSVVTETDAESSSSPRKGQRNAKSKEKYRPNKSLKKELDRNQQQNQSKIKDSESEDDAEKSFEDIIDKEDSILTEKVKNNEQSKEKSFLSKKSPRKELNRSGKSNQSNVESSDSDNTSEKLLHNISAEENSPSPEKLKKHNKSKEKNVSMNSSKKELNRHERSNQSKIEHSDFEDDAGKFFHDLLGQENSSSPKKLKKNDKLKKELNRSAQSNQIKIDDSESEDGVEKLFQGIAKKILQDFPAEENSTSINKVKTNEKSKEKSLLSQNSSRTELNRSKKNNQSKMVNSESEDDGNQLFQDIPAEEDSSSPIKLIENEESKAKSLLSQNSPRKELNRSKNSNHSKIMNSESEDDANQLFQDIPAEINLSSSIKLIENEESKEKSLLSQNSLRKELNKSKKSNRSKIMNSESEDDANQLFQDIPAEKNSSSSVNLIGIEESKENSLPLQKISKKELNRSKQNNQSKIVDSDSEDDAKKLFQDIPAEENSSPSVKLIGNEESKEKSILLHKASRKELNRSKQSNQSKIEDSDSEDGAKKLFQDIPLEENSSSCVKAIENEESKEKSFLANKSLIKEVNKSKQSNQSQFENSESEDDAEKLFHDIPAEDWHCENKSIIEVNVSVSNKKNISNIEESYGSESNTTVKNRKSQGKQIELSLDQNISYLNDTETNNSLSNTPQMNYKQKDILNKSSCEQKENEKISEKSETCVQNSRMSKKFSLSNSICKTIMEEENDNQSSDEPMEVDEESYELQNRSQGNMSFYQTESMKKQLTSLNSSKTKKSKSDKSINDSSIKCINKQKDTNNLSYDNVEDQNEKNRESKELIKSKMKDRKSLPNQFYKSIKETANTTPQRKSLPKSHRICNAFIDESSETETEENVVTKKSPKTVSDSSVHNSNNEHEEQIELDCNSSNLDKSLQKSIELAKYQNPSKNSLLIATKDNSNSDNDQDKTESSDSEEDDIDSDIAKEYNLAGKDISTNSEENIPGDECRASEEEFSDSDDDGSDLADFVISDNDTDDEEEDEEESDEEETEEEMISGVDVEGTEEEKINRSLNNLRTSTSSLKTSFSSSSGSESDDEETPDVEIQTIANEKSMNHSKSIKDKSFDTSKKNQYKKNSTKLQTSDNSSSESADEKVIPSNKSNASRKKNSLNTSKLVKNTSLNNSKVSKNNNMKVSEQFNSHNGSSESKHQKSMTNNKSQDHVMNMTSSSNDSESGVDEDSYQIIHTNEQKNSNNSQLNFSKKKQTNILIESSTPKPGIRQKTADSFVGKHNLSSTTIKSSRRKSESLTDLTHTKTNLTRFSIDENPSKSIIRNTTAHEASITLENNIKEDDKNLEINLKNRQPWKLIPLNKTTHVHGIDTPGTKCLKKSKLNDSFPILESMKSGPLTNQMESKNNTSKSSKRNSQSFQEVPWDVNEEEETDLIANKQSQKRKLQDLTNATIIENDTLLKPVLKKQKKGKVSKSFSEENQNSENEETMKSMKKKQNSKNDTIKLGDSIQKNKKRNITNESYETVENVKKNKKKNKNIFNDSTDTAENNQINKKKKKKKNITDESMESMERNQQNKKKKNITNESVESIKNIQKKKKKISNESTENEESNKQIEKKKKISNESTENVKSNKQNEKEKNITDESNETIENKQKKKNKKKKNVTDESKESVEGNQQNKKNNNSGNKSTEIEENAQKNKKKRKNIINESIQIIESNEPKKKKNKSMEQTTDCLQELEEKLKKETKLLEISSETEKNVDVKNSEKKKTKKKKIKSLEDETSTEDIKEKLIEGRKEKKIKLLEDELSIKDVKEKSIEDKETKKLKKKKSNKSNEIQISVKSEMSNTNADSQNLKKRSKNKSNEISDEKEVTDNDKNQNQVFKQKHTEQVEQISLGKKKNSLKRLSDEIISHLTDEPSQRPIKRQKLSGNKERSITMPSKSMFSPGKPKPVNLNVEDGYIPLSSVGGTTEFGVVNLEKIKKISKKSAKALNFREKMLARNPRQATAMYLAYLQKQKAKKSV